MTNNNASRAFKGKFESVDDAIRADYQYGLGYLKLENPDITNALSHLNAALSRSLETDNSYPEIYAAKAEALKKNGQYSESIECFDKAIASFRDTDLRKAFCYFGKYQAFKEIGKYDDAVHAIEKAISLNPNIKLFTDEKESISNYMQRSESESGSDYSSGSEFSETTETRTLSRKLSVKNLLKLLSRKTKSGSSSTSSDEDFSLSLIDEDSEEGIIDCDGDVFLAGQD